MGVLWDRLTGEVTDIFDAPWTSRGGQVVPDPSDLKLGSNDAIEFEAVILYADLAESTNLVDTMIRQFSAEVYKTYLHCAGNVIRQTGGTIVSYDGDRIMAVYLGDAKNSSAATAALKINGVVTQIINPGIIEKYGSGTYLVKQVVGIDRSQILVARTGVRGDNDLVWVGRAANYAAKFCSYRTSLYASIISKDVYDKLNDAAKLNETGEEMWTALSPSYNGVTLYGSSWYWINF